MDEDIPVPASAFSARNGKPPSAKASSFKDVAFLSSSGQPATLLRLQDAEKVHAGNQAERPAGIPAHADLAGIVHVADGATCTCKRRMGIVHDKQPNARAGRAGPPEIFNLLLLGNMPMRCPPLPAGLQEGRPAILRRDGPGRQGHSRQEDGSAFLRLGTATCRLQAQGKAVEGKAPRLG